LTEGLVIATVAVFRWLDSAKSHHMIDVLFFEGAVLVAAGALCDLCNSITFSHIRALVKADTSAPPPLKRSRSAGILLLSGLLICAHAVFWI